MAVNAADAVPGANNPDQQQQQQPSQQAPPQQQAAPPGEAANEWFWADGVKGTDKAPDWYDGKKYKSVAEQAKAYTDASKLIGTQAARIQQLESGVPKAPENYEFKLPDQYAQSLELKNDDPALAKMVEVGKKYGLSQDAFNDFFAIGADLIYNYEVADPAQEKQLIGDRADERMKSVIDWAGANMTPDMHEMMQGVLNKWSRPAEVFQLLEAVISGKRQPAMPAPGADTQAGGASVDEVNKKYRTPDPTTKRALIDTPEGRAAYRAELAKVVGEGHHQVIVGKR